MKKGKIDVGYYAHPSFFTIEDVSAIEGPLSIAAAGKYSQDRKEKKEGKISNFSPLSETDPVYPPQLRHDSEAALIKVGQPWQINLFSGVAHGFAVRGDPNNPQTKWAKEQAHAQAVAWFNHHL